MLKISDNSLKRINSLILTLIIVINGYVLLAPVAPAVQYEVVKRTTEPIDVNKPEQAASIDRSYNHLIIPEIRLDKIIVEGSNPDALYQGIWRRPASSYPDRGGNTVLTGHRFGYRPEMGNFYHLDKVKTGHEITVVWNGKLYFYRVSEVKVVEPEDVYVESPTEDDRITLYTCTPIWSAKQRLVVVANLEKIL